LILSVLRAMCGVFRLTILVPPFVRGRQSITCLKMLRYDCLRKFFDHF
jgi:hypothetical protein